jgi:O-antigen/teichoic acid export membrane protein
LKVLFMVALSMTYMGVILPVVIGEALLGGGVLFYFLLRFRASFSFAMARRLVRYSYPLVLSGLAMFVLHQADRYFLIRYHGLDAVGLYGLSYKLGYMVNALVFDSFALIWFPFVFSIGNDQRVAFTIRKVASYFAFGVCLVSLFVGLFSYELVTIMAAETFREAHVAIPIVVLAYVFWGVYQVLSTALYYRERTWVVSILVVLAACLNVLLNLQFVPEYGYIATAWTTVAAFAFLMIATWICSERALSVQFELVRITAPIALALALYSLAYFVIPDGSLPWSVGCKLALTLAFPLLLFVGGYFTREERDRGLGFLGRHAGRILKLKHARKPDDDMS